LCFAERAPAKPAPSYGRGAEARVARAVVLRIPARVDPASG
jgi:hypothetical protein